MATRSELTAARLRELLDYDLETGEFRWKVRRQGVAEVGALAGRLERLGYVHVKIDQHRYLRSRLAWFYVYGEWPPEEIDHVDGQRNNDRINNLRLASRSQNCANRRPHNKNGFKGIYPNGKKWRAQINYQEKRIHLGTYLTRKQAAAAYRIAARKLYGEFARW